MTTKAVYFNVHFKINPGQIAAFKGIAQTMIAETGKEPGALGYEWYFSDDGGQCRLLETYADQAAVEAHISGRAVQEIPKILAASSVDRFEVYGDPGAKAAPVLTSFGARIFARWNGLATG